MADIRISCLEKRYPNGFLAVCGVDVDVADGEFLVIVGPSGCGKSTLLRMVAGLEEISSGDLFIDGTRMNDVEPGRRDIAMVFQNYALYPHMSVEGNMAYGLKNARVPRDEIARKIADVARLLELEPYLKMRPNQLSGGQRQRVAMGRAIVRDPAAFLFDEPLSNLDAKLRVQMRLEIRKLQRRLATTALYVTHDQVEAMTMADRLVVMNVGRIEQIGTPMEVYANPASRFVAEFIGSPPMNMMNVQVEGGEVRFGAGAPVSVSVPDGRYHAGVRPETWSFANGDEANLRASVIAVEQLGADVLVHGVPLNGAGEAAEGDVCVRCPGTAAIPEPGGEVSLSVNSSAIHFFDVESGARIGST